MSEIELMELIRKLERKIAKMEVQDSPRWVYLTSPLTSTSWDGDSYSTTAKTVIDLSAVFGVPTGAKAVLVLLSAKDSGSAASTNVYMLLSPNDTAYVGALWVMLNGVPDDTAVDETGIVPCSATGDIYYQIVTTGEGTMDVNIQIWGYAI